MSDTDLLSALSRIGKGLLTEVPSTVGRVRHLLHVALNAAYACPVAIIRGVVGDPSPWTADQESELRLPSWSSPGTGVRSRLDEVA